MQNKGFALLAAGQFETRLQEFGLWTSQAWWELTSQALYYNLPYLFTDVTTIICYSFLNQSFLNRELTVFQKTILNLKFKIPAHNSIMLWARILNFKSRIVFWNIFFWRFENLKNESHFLKKATFTCLLSKYIYCEHNLSNTRTCHLGFKSLNLLWFQMTKEK